MRELDQTAIYGRGAGARVRSRLAAAAAIVAIAAAVMAATACGGDSKPDKTPKASSTPNVSATPGANLGAKTPIVTSPGAELTDFDLAQRGPGEPARGDFTGDRIIIPKAGVDAPFTYKVVPLGGQMPNPNSWDDVAYYDFVNWPGMGGLPGKGGNVVVAGHVDYINHGPAVFWDLDKLAVGDRVQIRLTDGTMVEYAVEFNKHIEAAKADWEAIVSGTADESITLITCGGEFSAGHYTNRTIIWGRRVG
jgi:LPXTG-site transpeptidase (sortase) family protein